MSEAEQDLDIAIGHYAELLASNLHAQRAAHFPPDAKKVMRTLTSGEAAELLGVDHTYLRKLHREGKIVDVETTAGSHRRYTLDDIWEIRQTLEGNAKKSGTYVPGRRDGDELQVISVVNFKGGSGKTTTSAHLAQRLALKGYRVLAIDLDPQASLSALHGIQPELDLMEGGTLYDAVRYDDPVPIAEVIRKTYIRGLDLIPGNLELMEERLHNLPDGLEEKVTVRARRGTTIVLVAKGQRLLGWMEFSDRIRETSEAAVRRLKQAGIKVVMLTGDLQEVAQTVGDAVGITEIVAGVKPDEKADHVRRLQENGVVTMIGDGINDAAALSVANVGIAMGAGSEIALESADIVLVRNDLADAVAALELGRATMTRIRSNLAWAFVYNLVGLPLAMGLLFPWTGWLLPPAFAAAAMSFSSVSVVANSLVLRGWEPPASLRTG